MYCMSKNWQDVLRACETAIYEVEHNGFGGGELVFCLSQRDYQIILDAPLYSPDASVESIVGVPLEVNREQPEGVVVCLNPIRGVFHSDAVSAVQI